MPYHYSICHSEKEAIEYPAVNLTKEEALDLANSYAWVEKLNYMEQMPQNKVYYNPSLEFKDSLEKNSFTLTANFLPEKELQFSLWYNRPVVTKPFFGLLGEKEKMKVVEKWNIDKPTAIKYLQLFFEKQYVKLENLMNT